MTDKTLSCPKCDKVGDDCGEHLPSWEELACYWKGKAEAQATRIETLEAALKHCAEAPFSGWTIAQAVASQALAGDDHGHR